MYWSVELAARQRGSGKGGEMSRIFQAPFTIRRSNYYQDNVQAKIIECSTDQDDAGMFPAGKTLFIS